MTWRKRTLLTLPVLPVGHIWEKRIVVRVPFQRSCDVSSLGKAAPMSHAVSFQLVMWRAGSSHMFPASKHHASLPCWAFPEHGNKVALGRASCFLELSWRAPRASATRNHLSEKKEHPFSNDFSEDDQTMAYHYLQEISEAIVAITDWFMAAFSLSIYAGGQWVAFITRPWFTL